MKHVPYHKAVGSLMYAMLGTHPDICYTIQTASKFNNKPGLAHWEAVKHIFRYLIGTKNLWPCYGSLMKELLGYTDADGSVNKDRRAISGYAFMVNGGAVSWSVKQQELISLSATESEYVTVTHTAKEALWLCSLISQLFGVILPPTILFSDNQSVIVLMKEHQYHAHTKHIDICFHFI